MIPANLDKQLEGARTNLAAMQARYTDEYPDVKKLKETIAALEKLKKEEADQARSDIESSNATPSQVQAGMPLVQLKTQIKVNKAELEQASQQIQQLQQAGQLYQARLNATPAVEAQMEDMTRDRATMQKAYADLMAKKTGIGPGHQPGNAAARRAVPHHRSAQLARPAGIPRPLQVLAGGCRWRPRAGPAVRIRLRISWTTASAASRPWRKRPICRFSPRFHRCRLRASSAAPA